MRYLKRKGMLSDTLPSVTVVPGLKQLTSQTAEQQRVGMSVVFASALRLRLWESRSKRKPKRAERPRRRGRGCKRRKKSMSGTG
jgi:hypothetical protein